MQRLFSSVGICVIIALMISGCLVSSTPELSMVVEEGDKPGDNLRLVHDPNFGWTAAVPADWISCNVPGGQFSRGLPTVDPSKLYLWTYFDRSVDNVLDELVEVGGVTSLTVKGERASPSLFWKRYQGGARSDPELAIEFAVAARDSNVYLVLLVARQTEMEVLVNAVLLPAVDSFVPGPPDPPTSVLAANPPAPDYWPTNGWRKVPPESKGVDSAQLQSLLTLIHQEALPIDSITVIRHGYVVFDEAFPPYRSTELHELHSVTKSIISSLVGIALSEKGLPVDTHLLELFSARSTANIDERKRAVTLESLLTMTAGLDWTEWDADYESGTGNDLVTMIESGSDWTQYVLDRQMAHEPGETFLYNSGASYLLSAVVSQLVGTPAADYAAERLFLPIGIRTFEWPAGPEGVTMGWGNLRLRPSDLARIGLLYLHHGEWDGQQIIPERWVEAATTDWVKDPLYEYGYQWWLDAADGYAYMSGRFGQTVIVAPEQDMVIVILANLPEKVPGALSVPRWLAEKFILPAAH